jgi:Resolvase, N terminal domain
MEAQSQPNESMHMEKPQIPVAILVRVSTAKQETARQISELRQYAGGKGYEVLEVCEETISGSAQEDQRHSIRRGIKSATILAFRSWPRKRNRESKELRRRSKRRECLQRCRCLCRN